MRTSFLAAGAALLALAVAAPSLAADKPAKPSRSCFFNRDVSSFSAVDDQTVNIRVGVKDYYRLDLMGRCPDIDWNNSIALISRGGSSICDGMDATIVTRSAIGPQRCPVKTVTKLTPDEVAALKASKKKP